jgi:hypothetical protein
LEKGRIKEKDREKRGETFKLNILYLIAALLIKYKLIFSGIEM